VNEILPKPIVGPDDSFDPGEEFLARLTRVASTEVRPPRPAPIAFATTQEAIDANDELLRKYDFDLEKLFRAYTETTLGFGSEFRPLAQLEQVLGGHPEFEVLADLIENGMDYKFKREITSRPLPPCSTRRHPKLTRSSLPRPLPNN
jgi:hypothetical protein